MFNFDAYWKQCAEAANKPSITDQRYNESMQRTAQMFQYMKQENAKYKWYQVPPCPQPRPFGEKALGGMGIGGCYDKKFSYAPGTVFEREVSVEGVKMKLHYAGEKSSAFAAMHSIGELVEEDKKMLQERFPDAYVKDRFKCWDLSPNYDRIITPVYSNSYWRRLWWRFLNPFQRFRWAFQNPNIHLSASFAPVILVYIVLMVFCSIFYYSLACYIFFTAWFFILLIGAYGGGCDEYPYGEWAFRK